MNFNGEALAVMNVNLTAPISRRRSSLNALHPQSDENFQVQLLRNRLEKLQASHLDLHSARKILEARFQELKNLKNNLEQQIQSKRAVTQHLLNQQQEQRHQKQDSWSSSEEVRDEEFKLRADMEEEDQDDVTPQQAPEKKSDELCRHFLRGKCRYKSNCKFSHKIDNCPYCGERLPSSKVAASAHLSRCSKSAPSSVVGNISGHQSHPTLFRSASARSAFGPEVRGNSIQFSSRLQM